MSTPEQKARWAGTLRDYIVDLLTLDMIIQDRATELTQGIERLGIGAEARNTVFLDNDSFSASDPTKPAIDYGNAFDLRDKYNQLTTEIPQSLRDVLINKSHVPVHQIRKRTI